MLKKIIYVFVVLLAMGSLVSCEKKHADEGKKAELLVGEWVYSAVTSNPSSQRPMTITRYFTFKKNGTGSLKIVSGSVDESYTEYTFDYEFDGVDKDYEELGLITLHLLTQHVDYGGLEENVDYVFPEGDPDSISKYYVKSLTEDEMILLRYSQYHSSPYESEEQVYTKAK